VDRRDVAVTLPWMGAGTEMLVRAVDALPDDALRAPSALPDWSRAHVVAHVARNAEALTRLATWARTGVETPMYPSREHRAAAIESSAQQPAAALRHELATTAEALDAALAALEAPEWEAQVRTAQGRPVPAAEIPWMRVREVWVHAVDLDSGVTVADLPPEVVDALLDDAVTTLSAAEGCPAALLAPTDREWTWSIGPGGGPNAEPEDGALRVAGAAADVLGWLVGRAGPAALTATTADGTRAEAPDLPRWL
jgi:maleylpyruvate isomerase